MHAPAVAAAAAGRLLLSIIFVSLRCLAAADTDVRVGNGMSDTVVNAGSPFRMSIPPDAFQGTVASYRLTEAGGDRLPHWLQWDHDEQALVGVPQSTDVGPYYIAVDAYGASNNRSHVAFAQDVFSINVRRFGGDQLPCLSEDRLGVYLLLVLDMEVGSLSPVMRLRTLRMADDHWLRTSNDSRLSLLSWSEVSPMLVDVVLSGGDHQLDAVRRSLSGQAVLLQRFGCTQPFALEVSGAVTALKKRLIATPELLISKQPLVRAAPLTWNVAEVRKPKAKRQAFYDEHYVQSKYGQVGMSTDAFGSRMWITPIPQRPWFSMRPTSRIDSRPPVVTTAPSTRQTTPFRPTARLEPVRPETTAPMRPAAATTTTTTMVPMENSRPEVRKSLGTVVCYKGVLCEVSIPDDTFYDQEDGSTVTLRLSLKRLDHEHEPEWIHLDTLDRTLFGLNLETGKWHYSLTATDRQGKAVSDAFAIRVLEVNRDQWESAANHRVTLTFAEDFKQMHKQPASLVKLISRLAAYFQEAEASSIYVHSIRSGSTIVEWSNVTLLKESCPRSSIEVMLGRMKKKNGELRREFISFMRPEFTAKSVSVSYAGACVHGGGEEEGQQSPATPPGVVVKKPAVTSEPESMVDTTLMSTVVPAVVILLLLIVAGTLLCFYCRKSRRGSKQPEDSERKYLSKGTPIIFPDEVDAENECTAASPMLLKEEKPPLQITELTSFQTNGPAGASSPKEYSAPTLSDGSNRHGGGSATDDGRSMEEANTTITDNPLYRPPPPPPFDSARMAERSPKPRQAHPTFREPPPYVPP